VSDPPNADALAPTPVRERIHALDVLRGFALFGIALVNVEFFTRPLQDINQAGIDPTAQGTDYLTEWLTYFFVQGKFWTLFALLFGIGFAVMIERADRAGRAFVPLYLRRTLALLGIGLVHAVVIWSGDILVSYAVAALALLAARQVRRAWVRWRTGHEPAPMTATALGIWGGMIYGVPLALILAAGAVTSLPGTTDAPSLTEKAEMAKRKADEAKTRARAVEVYSGGTFSQAVSQRVDDTAWQLGTLPIGTFWVVGLFLMGGAILRSGVLSRLESNMGALRQARNTLLPIGLAAMAVSTWLGTAAPDDELNFAAATQVTLYLVASLLLALAYAAIVLLMLPEPNGRRLHAWFAPAGRMALTNYLLQSVIGTLVFYGYGLGLWGHVDRGWQAIGVFVVFGLQVMLSRWWLARFHYGPVEWVWRCITYARVVPIHG